MDDQPVLSTLQQQTVDLTSAWDERRRLFDRLRDLRLTDKRRKELLTEYKAAASHFDSLRDAILS